MLKILKKLYNNIKKINKSVDKYQKDTVVPSLPTIAYVNKAKKFIDEKQYGQAKEILISALDISNQDPLVYKYLGKICEFNREFHQAVEYYEKSANLNQQDKEIYLRLGMCLLYSDFLDRAILAFEKANINLPNNTDVFTGWGMVLMKQKKYALARDKFLTASQISKYNFTAILLSAVMELRLGDYAPAEEKLTFLVKVAPNESSLYEYSHLKLLQRDYDTSLEYAQKVLEVNKRMLPVYFILGEIYSIRRDLENLNKIYEEAINLDLDCSTLHFEWGKCLVRMLEFEKAGEQFNFVIEREPQYPEIKLALALLNSYNGNFDLLNELKEKNQTNVYIQEALGFEYLSKNMYNEAIEMFKKAVKNDCNQTYNYYGLALSYVGLNNKDKARDNFEKFVQSNPNYLKGLLEYSQWLINISDYDEAQRKLKKAQKLDSNNVEVLNLLFLSQYTLVKNNISEYNIKESISVANKAIELGRFDYYPEKQELEGILSDLQGK